ncbi:hypothetical protein HRR75_002593 [Exophiala dermatitidis]|nr:hypothetical protein HRR75_002593 [Exophiala dermatitidis]
MSTITEFQEKVYSLVLLIPPGQVTTYAAVAKALNTSPRAVGGALRCNPFWPTVPCHRVIASDGSLGGFFGQTWQKKNKNTLTTTTTTTRTKIRKTKTKTKTRTTTTAKNRTTQGPNNNQSKSISHPQLTLERKIQLLKSEGVEFIQHDQENRNHNHRDRGPIVRLKRLQVPLAAPPLLETKWDVDAGRQRLKQIMASSSVSVCHHP